jgi:molecular chaperone DnaK (HSP70)
MKKIFSNKTIIPNKKRINLKNKKNEKDLIIKIYQGENDNNSDNYFLKEFKLKNIGENDEFEITFEISVDSILSVLAKKVGNDRIEFISGKLYKVGGTRVEYRGNDISSIGGVRIK